MVNLLTPNDVRDAEFTPRRLRTGYDMEEVDLFLDDGLEMLNAARKVVAE